MFTKESFLKWLKAAGIRAIKTVAQTMIASISIGMAISDVNWTYILSVAAVAGICSLLTSIAGLPELKEESGDNNE